MSQVTRCPSCGTRFKVVADQLRISQGWVRCGMCQSVFDASEDLQTVPDDVLQSAMDQVQADEVVNPVDAAKSELVNAPDLEADSADVESVNGQLDENSETPAADEQDAVLPPVAEAKTELEPEPESQPDELVADEVEPAVDETSEPSEPVEPSFIDQAKPLVPELEAPAESAASSNEDAEDETADQVQPDEHEAEDAADKAEVEPVEAEDEVAVGAVATDALDASLGDDVEIISDQHLLSTDVDAVRSEVNAAQPAEEDGDEVQEKLPAVDEPGFVRQARRQAFWHSTGMRVALVLGSVLAAGGLLAQHAWQQRDALAAEHPALAPVLTKACKAVGCELQARREIADVVISGSGFKQLADAHEYQWSLTLENRSDAPVATPMAELTLMDAQDKPLLRRVVDLKPLGAPEQLQPHQEWSVNVPVLVQDLSAPVAGYRALVFYP